VPRKIQEIKKNMKRVKRKQLPGYACDECVKVCFKVIAEVSIDLNNSSHSNSFQFYEAIGYSEEEMSELINKCTKHRGQKRPATPPC